MELWLDEYAHLDSPIHRWESRYRLIGLAVLIFAFSLVQDLRLLPAMLAVTLALYAVSRLPFSFLATRLRYPGVFLLMVALILPFLSGDTVLLRLGPLTVRQEGCLELLLIGVRFVSILTVSLVLFGAAPFLTTIKTMRALGLPPVLADMMLLSYRYLFEIADDLGRMETAIKLRGFRARRLSGRGLVTLASLAGSLLVRSYERSERIYQAMILRGYGYGSSPRDEFQTRRRDVLALGAALLVAAGVVGAQMVC